MTNSFDSLYESLLTELTPIDIVPGYSGTGEETTAEFPEKSAGKYALTPEQTKEVAEKVIAKLRELGNHSDKTFKDFQEEDIAPIIKEVAGINLSNAKFAARVVHNALKVAGIITDERDGTKLVKAKPTPSDIENTVVAANEEGEAQETSSDEHTSTEDEDLVYYKTADFDIDDAELEKKWNKLPEGNLEWEQIVKLVGTTSALKLLEKGALLSTEREEVEETEDEEGGEGSPEVANIETDEDEDKESGTIKNPERFTNAFNRTFSPYAHSEE